MQKLDLKMEQDWMKRLTKEITYPSIQTVTRIENCPLNNNEIRKAVLKLGNSRLTSQG